MKAILSLLVLFTSFNSFAQLGATVQYIDCRFENTESDDRVIVSLSDENNGTFFYVTGLDADGNGSNTGKLKLTRAPDIASQKNIAQFRATYQGDDYGKPFIVDFNFSMPKNMIFKVSNDFKASVANGAGYSSGLTCFSRIYPAGSPVSDYGLFN